MGIETERKFLINAEFRHLSIEKIQIIQRYLSIDPDKTIRLRIAGEKAFITIKNRPKAGSFSRNEWEFEIPLTDAVQMMSICLPGKIEKTRYIVPNDKHKWEVDVFHDKNEGLIIAEIELESENEEFIKPAWIGDEVTGKSEYYNANLLK